MNLRSLLLDAMYVAIPGAAMGVASKILRELDILLTLFLGSRDLFVPPLPANMINLCPDIIRDRCENEAIFGGGLSVSSFFFTMTVAVGAVISANMAFRYYSKKFLSRLTLLSVEKTVYYREASSGINKFAYFLAKCLFDLYTITRNTFITVTLFLFIADPTGRYGQWFGTVYFLSFAGNNLQKSRNVIEFSMNFSDF